MLFIKICWVSKTTVGDECQVVTKNQAIGFFRISDGSLPQEVLGPGHFASELEAWQFGLSRLGWETIAPDLEVTSVLFLGFFFLFADDVISKITLTGAFSSLSPCLRSHGFSSLVGTVWTLTAQVANGPRLQGVCGGCRTSAVPFMFIEPAAEF